MEGLFGQWKGPDGAGKTTVINQLIPLLQKRNTLIESFQQRRAWWKSYRGRYSESDSGCE